MHQRHIELARIGLGAVDRFGFALAGGYALTAHGLIDRPSEDVDLFTNRLEPVEFARAVEAIVRAYEMAGHRVEVVKRADLFARLMVGAEDPVRVKLAYDWRGNRPALLEIGPVLDRDDAVAEDARAVGSWPDPRLDRRLRRVVLWRVHRSHPDRSREGS